jgi:hypothetical protein
MELPAKGAHWLLVNPMNARTSFEFDRISACISLGMADKSSAALQRGCPVGLQTRRPPRNPQILKCRLAPEPSPFRNPKLRVHYIAPPTPPSPQKICPGFVIQYKRFTFNEIAFLVGNKTVNKYLDFGPLLGAFSSLFAQICVILAYSRSPRFQPHTPTYLPSYLRLVG